MPSVEETKKLAMQKWHVDVAHLRDLLQQAGWDTYDEYAERVIAESVKLLIEVDPPGPATDWRKGYIMGLKRALQLPHEVLRNVGLARTN